MRGKAKWMRDQNNRMRREEEEKSKIRRDDNMKSEAGWEQKRRDEKRMRDEMQHILWQERQHWTECVWETEREWRRFIMEGLISPSIRVFACQK